MNKSIFKLSVKSLFGLILMFSLSMVFGSCKEDIDDSNYAIATEQTITDYLAGDSTLTDIKAIFDRVKLGNSDDASSLTSVLSARGNYTVFAASNDAVEAYVESLTGSKDINSLSDEQAELIAYNCIIDNGDDDAYESSDFPTSGTFSLANLNDRLLSCEQDTAQAGNPYVINGTSTITKENIQLSNGVVHVVNSVISLSSNTVAELIQAAPNMKIMGKLLELTGLSDSLSADR